MQALVYFSLAVYFGFYVFEGPVRYILNMFGADSLIFIRDIILATPLLLIIFIRQFISKNLHPAFIVFAVIISIHGLISYINIGNPFVIGYCVKLLITMLAGAVLAPYLMQPSPRVVWVVFALWAITFIGVFLDKYFVEYPWTGLSTTIGDIQVEISRDWDIEGANKRAGGLMRSSINAAIISPLLALVIIFNSKKIWQKSLVMLGTIALLYWTTQKASILAFAMVCGVLIAAYNRPIPMLKIAITIAIILMISLPIITPQFEMPQGEGGVFSLGSFYLRVEDMWPRAWEWIDKNEIFPFGVGLGGIGGAMRFYAQDSVNYADNLFILLYAYFGMFAVAYLAWLWWACMRVKNSSSDAMAQALSIILFLIFYGCALSIIEDQMGSLFLGAAASWLASEYRRDREKNRIENARK